MPDFKFHAQVNISFVLHGQRLHFYNIRIGGVAPVTDQNHRLTENRRSDKIPGWKRPGYKADIQEVIVHKIINGIVPVGADCKSQLAAAGETAVKAGK